METFTITSNTSVAELKKQFCDQIGGSLRVYDGRSLASDETTLISLGAKEGELDFQTNLKVGEFEANLKSTHNLTVKIYTKNNKVKVLDDIVVSSLAQLPSGMTKANMEEYLSSQKEQTAQDDVPSESAAVLKKFKNIPIIEITTQKADINCDAEGLPSPTFGVLYQEDSNGDSRGIVMLCDNHNDLCSTVHDYMDENGLDEDIEVVEASKIIGYGEAANPIENIMDAIGVALNEFYDPGCSHYNSYQWPKNFTDKAVFSLNGELFLAYSQGGIDFINLNDAELDVIKKDLMKAPKPKKSKNVKSAKKGKTSDEAEVKDNTNEEDNEELIPTQFGRKYGYVNSKGERVIKPQFKGVECFHEGLACVTKDFMTYGFINKKGEYVIEPEFEDASAFKEGIAPAKKHGKWGFINHQGEFVIKPQYQRVRLIDNGHAIVKKDGKCGVINKEGKYVIKPFYDDFSNSSKGLFVEVEKNGKYGLINYNGEVVVKPQFDEFGFFIESEGLVPARQDKKWGFVNANGNVIKPQFDRYSYLKEGRLRVKKDEKVALINTKGEVIPIPDVDDIKDFYEGLAVVEKDNKYGYINPDGELVIPMQFDDADGFHEGLAGVRKDGKGGFIDSKGKFVIEPKFKGICHFEGGLAEVAEDEYWGLIDKEGHFVVEPNPEYLFSYKVPRPK